MSFKTRYVHYQAKKQAQMLFGSLAQHGEEVVAALPGRVGTFPPAEGGPVLDTMVVTDAATYFAMDEVTLRLPHTSVSSEEDDGARIRLWLHANVTALLAAPRGARVTAVAISHTPFVCRPAPGHASYVEFVIAPGLDAHGSAPSRQRLRQSLVALADAPTAPR